MTEAPHQIAFPKVDQGSQALAVPPAPAGPLDQGLSQMAATGETRKGLVCKDLLVGETAVQARTEAAQMYVEMKKNSQVVMTYGLDAMAAINNLMDRLLREDDPVKIDEVRTIMRELSGSMRGVKGKYDLSDPKVRKDYDKWLQGVKGLFGRGRDFLDDLRADITSLDAQFNRIIKEVSGRQHQMLRNVAHYDELYELNEAEINNLIYKIGVMEIIAEMAEQELLSIPVGDASAGDRGKEKRDQLGDLKLNLDLKIAEYKGRLFVAWTTSPQTRMSRQLSVGMAMKLNEVVCVTIPTMKGTIVEWRKMIQTLNAAKLSEEISAAHNATLQGYFEAAKVAAPLIAGAIQTPTLTLETVAAMADSVSAQADALVAAIETGAQRRADLEAGMMEAKKVLDSSGDRINDAVVDHVIANATRPLRVASTVLR